MFNAEDLVNILDELEFDAFTAQLDDNIVKPDGGRPKRDHLSAAEAPLLKHLDDTLLQEHRSGPDYPVVSHLHFDWSTTTQGLKAFNPSIKIAYKAKFQFACAISSFADDIMEYLLTEKCCRQIKVIDIYDAFAHFNEPLGSFHLIHAKPLSLRRIMIKYRNLYKFEFASDAKRVFACLMTSLMINIASSIHIHRNHAKRTMQMDEVRNITDTIVFVRDYHKKYTMSRSIHASSRVRKPDGKF